MKALSPTRFLPALLGIIGLALSAGTTQADIFYTGTNFDIELSTPEQVGVTLLWAVTLTAHGKNGAEPNTFDSTSSTWPPEAGQGITTAGDLLHQVWEFGTTGIAQTPDLTLQGDVPPIPQDVDTHFLVTDNLGDLTKTLDPSENRPTLDPTEDPRAGFGNELIGSFADKTTSGPVWAFAYLVVPHGTEVFLDFEIGAAGFPSEEIGGSFVVIPEPSTLLLLAFSIVGLLPLRRRGVR